MKKIGGASELDERTRNKVDSEHDLFRISIFIQRLGRRSAKCILHGMDRNIQKCALHDRMESSKKLHPAQQRRLRSKARTDK